MSNKVLTVFNAKKALRVINTNEPEKGTWKFEFCAVRSSGRFSNNDHRVTNEQTGEQIVLNYNASEVMKSWEVVESRPGADLEELYQSAVTSYGWSSMDPERAARVMLHSYEDSLDVDLTNIPESAHAEYTEGFKDQLRTIIARNGNVASPMVTGPAKFNTRRNVSALSAYQKAVDDFKIWRERKMKSILKAIEDAKPQSQRDAEEWKRIEASLLDTLSVIESIDDGSNRMSYRSLFVSSIVNKANTLANNGRAELLERYIKTVENYNETHSKPAITSRHKFWTLREVLVQVQERQADLESRNDVEIECDMCTIVKCYSQDRLQLVFDGKPESSVIQTLKHNGFRWSPKNGAWQRQLTYSALRACSKITDVNVEELISDK